MRQNLENFHRIATVAAIALASLLKDASARTWHILPDGQGDVATIQAAIDVAASGAPVRPLVQHNIVSDNNAGFDGRGIVMPLIQSGAIPGAGG